MGFIFVELEGVSFYFHLKPHKIPACPAVGVSVRFCVLRPSASCPGILAWFGHFSGRAANVEEDIPFLGGPVSWHNPIKDVFI